MRSTPGRAGAEPAAPATIGAEPASVSLGLFATHDGGAT